MVCNILVQVKVLEKVLVKVLANILAKVLVKVGLLFGKQLLYFTVYSHFQFFMQFSY